MKYIVVLGDGWADLPQPQLQGRTPLQAAQKPAIDGLAARSLVGLVRTVPAGMKPGSDNANLAVMGYDPHKNYTGRSPLEAVSMGVSLGAGDVAYRCNLVTLSGEGAFSDLIMDDYSADEISTEEARELVEFLVERLNTDDLNLFAGVSYRHCLRASGFTPGATGLTPPHDIPGRPVRDYLPSGVHAERLLKFMRRSHELLSSHPLNAARIARGQRPANSCWLWGEGTKPELADFKTLFGVSGAVISAVDLIKGIGICAGLEVIEVEGATGNLNTNFSGKAAAALDALKRGHDFVYIHIEAPDECGHRGETENKVKSIELIDSLIVARIIEKLNSAAQPYRLLILPDHPTPLNLRSHTSDPVPFLLYDSTKNLGPSAPSYDEQSAGATGFVVEEGHMLMPQFLQADKKAR